VLVKALLRAVVDHAAQQLVDTFRDLPSAVGIL
jgi:hypothetical protein